MKYWQAARKFVALVAASLMLTSGLVAFSAQAANAAPSVTTLSAINGSIAGGLVINITGSGLTNTTAVTFGGVAGSALTNLSPSAISVTTPAHAAGVFDVVVTSNGASTTLSNAFTFNALTALSAPTNEVAVTATSAASGFGVAATFTAVTGATSTRAELYNNATNALIAVNNNYTTGTYFYGLAASTTYRINLYSIGDGVTKDTSAPSSSTVSTGAVATIATPAAPTAGSITQTSMTWTAVSQTGTLSYRYTIYSPNSTTVYRVIDGSSTLTLTGLAPGTPYYATVHILGNGTSFLNSAESAMSTVATTLTSGTQLASGQPTFSSATPDSVTVASPTVTNGSLYRCTLYRADGVTPISSLGASTGGTLLTFTGLDPATNYNVACISIGDGINYTNSALSSMLLVTTQSVGSGTLTAPTIVSSTMTSTTATLQWSNPNSVSTVYFNAYLYDSTGALVQRIYSGAAYSQIFRGLTPGAQYKLGVSMFSVGYPETSITQTALLTAPAASAATQLTAPVVALASTSATSLTASISTSSVGALQYEYFLWASNQTTLVSSIETTGSYTFSDLTPGTTYYLSAVAIGDGQTVISSSASAKVSTSTAAFAITTLSAPTGPGINTSTLSPTSAAFSFTAAGTGTPLYYQVKVYAADGITLLQTIPNFVTGNTINGLQPATTYQLSVTAIGDGVFSATSAESAKITITTRTTQKLAAVPPAVYPASSVSATIVFAAPVGTVSTVLKLYDANNNLILTVPSFTSATAIPTSLAPNTSYKASLSFIGNGSTYLDSDESQLVSFTTAAAYKLMAPTLTLYSGVVPTPTTAAFLYATSNATSCRLSIFAADGTTVIARVGQYVSSTSITGLLPNTTYKASIKCFGNGVSYLDSDESPQIAFSTMPVTQLLPPTITAITVGTSGATITETTQTGSPANYRIKLYDANDVVVQTIITTTQAFSFVGLKPATAYKATVAIIGNGITNTDSVESDKFLFTTPAVQSDATPPISVNTGNVTSNSASFTINAAVLLNFVVRLYKADGSTVIASQTTSSTSVAFSNLVPNTTYWVSVTALENGNGYATSAEGPKISFTTLQAVQAVTGAISSATATPNSLAFVVGAVSNGLTYIGRLYASDGTTLLATYPGYISGTAIGGLLPSTLYFFSVQGIGNGRNLLDGREGPKYPAYTQAPIYLTAPVSLTTSTPTPNSIAVSFTAITGAISTTLRLYSQSTGQLIATLPNYTSGAVVNAPILPNTAYRVTLQSIGTGINSFNSDESPAITVTTPPPITLFAPLVTSSTGSALTLNLSFSVPVGATTTVTRLYSADGSTLLQSLPATGTGASFGNLQPNTAYQVTVQAIGNGYSYLTSAESPKMLLKTSPASLLSAPTYSVYVLNGTTVGLSFISSVYALSYTAKIYSADGSTLLATVPVQTGQPIGGLSPNTTYQVSLTLVANGVNYLTSPESFKTPFTTPALTTALPTVPNLAWVNGIGGYAADSTNGATLVDSANNVYIAGYFTNQATFGSGSAAVTLTSAGNSDIYLAKYSASGTLLWVRQAGGTGYDTSYSLAFDATGNVVLVGTFNGVASFGSAGARQSITALAGNDGFIAKYAPDGTFAWVRQLSGTGDEYLKGVSSDRAGNVFVTGYFTDNLIAGTGSGKVTLRTFGGNDGFVAKFAANGNFTWVKQFGGALSDNANSINVDKDGNVFVGGTASAGAVFGTGSTSKEFFVQGGTDSFLAKYSNDGDFIWVQGGGGISSDAVNGVTSDANGNAYVVGSTYGGTFGSGADSQNLVTPLTLATSATQAGYIAKYGPTGRLIWIRQMAGMGNNLFSGVSVDASGNVYSVGQFSLSTTITAGSQTQTLVAQGGNDAVFVKLTSSGTLVWARNMGSSANDGANGVAVNSNGAVAVVGFYNYDLPVNGGVFDFAAGAQAATLTSAGSTDAFVALLQTGADQTNTTLATPSVAITEIRSTGFVVNTLSQPGAASYTLKLYNSTGATLLQTVANYMPGRLISGLTANTSYKVTLTAIGDGASTVTSAESAQVSFSTALASTIPVMFNVGSSQATVSFNPIAGATGYSINVYDASGANKIVTLATSSAPATVVSGLLPGTTYQVAVKPVGDGQSSLNFAEGSPVTFTTAPATTLAAPVATQSFSTATSIVLNIPTVLVSPQMINGTYGWLIKVYAADGVTLLGSYLSTTASATINGLSPASTYKVSVTAIGDGVAYLNSAEGSKILMSTAQATVATAPTPIVTQVTAATVAVNFAPIPALSTTGYVVRINGFVFTSATSGSIFYTGVLPNATNSVSVQAIGDGTNIYSSPIGASVSYTAPSTTITPLTTPSLGTGLVTPTSIQVVPSPVVGALGYWANVYASDGTTLLFGLSVPAAGTTISNLLAGTNYKIEVIALGNGQFLSNSAPSQKISVTTLPGGRLSAPINLQASSITSNGYTVSFSQVPGASGYYVKVYAADGTTLLGSEPAVYTGTNVYIVAAGTTSYKISVVAIGDGVNFTDSPESAFTSVDLVPARVLSTNAPQILDVTSNSALINLLAYSGALYYNVRVYASDRQTLVAEFPAVSTTAFKINAPLTPNTTYYVTSQSVGNGFSYLTSPESAMVAFTTTAAVKLGAPTPQILVGQNRAVFVQFPTVQLGNLTSASVRADIYSADGSTLLFSVAPVTTGTMITGLAAGTTYRIALTAIGDNVNFLNSDPSAQLTFTTPSAVRLAAPIATVSANSASSFKVTFNPITGAVSYAANVYLSDGVTLVRSLPVASGSAIFGLTAGTAYKITLVSVGDGATLLNSLESAPVAFTFTGTGSGAQLAAPTTTATAVSPGSERITFTQQSGAISYTFKRYSADGTTLLATIPNFVSGTVVTNLSPATAYKVTVTAIGDGTTYLTSAEGAQASFTTMALVTPDLLPTLAVVATTSVANSSSITTTFAPSAGAIRYALKLYAADGASLVAVINNFVSGGSITGLAAGAHYFVTVTAIGDGVNYLSSPESAQESVYTTAATALTAPTLTKAGQNSSSVALSFTAQTGAVAYTLSLYAADGTTLIGTYSPFNSGDTITGLAANTTYKVSIKAIGNGISNSTSAASAQLSVTTALAIPAPTVSSIRSTSAAVTFTAVPGATGYTVKIYDATGVTLLRTITSYVSGTSITGLSASTGYQVSVGAIGDGSTVFDSDFSPLASFSTPAPITLARPVLSPSASALTSLAVAFAPVADALSYTATVYAANGSTVVTTVTNYVSGTNITGLTASSNYFITVNAIGDGTTLLNSGESAQLAIATVLQTTLAAPTATASGTTSSATSITFTAPAGSTATTLKLYAADGTTLLRTIANFSTGNNITGLAAGTTYKVTLTAIGDGFANLTSAEGSATSFSTASVTTLAAPTVTTGSLTTTSFVPTFAAVPGATAYLAKLYAANGTTLLRSISGVTSGSAITGLTSGTTYVVTFSAIGDGTSYLNSADGAQITVTTTTQTNLTAPTPSVVRVSPNTITFAFTANPNAVSTRAKIYTGDGLTLVGEISGATTGMQFTGLSPDTDYQITLQSMGDGLTSISSAESAQVLAHTSQPVQLVAPTAVVNQVGSGSFNLTFTNTSNALSYTANIYASDGVTLISSYQNVSGTGSLITGLNPSTTYKVTLVAVGDEAFYLSSTESARVSLTTAAGVVQLNAPNPNIDAVGSTSARISFGAIANATSYVAKIYAADGTTLLQTLTNFTSGSSITGLSQNTSYLIALLANGDGANFLTSNYGSKIGFTTAPPANLATPSITSASATSSSISLVFAGVDQAVDYAVKVYASNGTTLLNTIGSYAIGAPITGLAASTTYVFKVSALGDGISVLDSAYSAGFTAQTTAPAVLSTPSPSVFSQTQQSAVIVFTPISGAISYTAKLYAANGTTLLRTIANFNSGATISGLTAGTTYNLTLTAVGDGSSNLSSAESAQLNFATYAVSTLSAPAAFISNQTAHSFSVSFGAVLGAVSYTAKLYAADGTTLISSVDGFVSGATFTGLNVSSTYQVAIVAHGDGSNYLDSAIGSLTQASTTAIPALFVPDTIANATGTTTANATFSAQSNATSFELRLYAADGTTLLQTISNYASGAAITGLTPNTGYGIAVRAMGDGTNYVTSALSSVAFITTAAAVVLPSPTVSLGTPTFTSVTVNFGAVSNATAYVGRLYSGTGTLLRTLTSFATATVISGLTPGTSYSFAVLATGDTTNYLDSPESTRATFTTVAPVQLSAPSVTTSGIGRNGFTFNYGSVANASGYSAVLYATNGTTVVQTFSSLSGATAVTGLNPNTTYKLAVTTVGDGTYYLTSAPSALVTISTLNLDALATPAVVAVVPSTSTGLTSATINFAAIAHAVAYTAKLYTSGGSLLRTITGFTSGTAITGLTAGTGYLVGVTANSDGTSYLDSAESTRAGFTTVAPITLAAPAFTTSNIGQFGFSFGFTPVANATGYSAVLYAADGTTVVRTFSSVTGNTSVTGLSPNTTYKLSMTAIGDGGLNLTSNSSALASVATLALNPLTTPIAVVVVPSTSTGLTSVTVSFGAVANAVSYTAKLYTSGGTFIRAISGFTSGSAITGLTQGTGYLVGVTAIADGTNYLDSAESTRAGFTTLAPVTLAAPAFTIGNVGIRTLQFSFTPVANATGYSAVLYAADGTTVVQTFSNVTGTTTVTGLTPNTTYKLSMTAIGDAGLYVTSNASALTTTATNAIPVLNAPTPVAVVSPTASGLTSVGVQFANSSAISFTAKLYSSTGSLLRTITGFNPGDAITGLTPATTYSVSVTAIGDGTNLISSAESAHVTFNTLTPNQLSAPAFTTSNIGQFGFSFGFTPVANATGYSAVLYAADGTTVVRTFSSVTGTTSVTGLSPNTTYKLSMTAIGDGGLYLTSNASALTSVATLALSPLTAPVVVAVVPSTATGLTSVTVSFGAIANAVSYTAKLYTAGGTFIRAITGFTSGSVITGLTQSTGYLVGVTAIADGTNYLDSAESTRAGFSTLTPAQLVVTAPTTSSVGQLSLQANFTPVTGAVSYTVTVYAADGTTVVQTITGLTGATTVSGLTAGATYKLTVTAIGDGTLFLNSAESAQTSVTTSLTPVVVTPPAPPAPAKINLTSSDVSVNLRLLTVDLTKILVNQDTSNATATFVSLTPGITGLNIINGKLVLKASAFFSGAASIHVLVNNQGTTVEIDGKAYVLPQAVVHTELSAWSLARSTVRWWPSPNAASYLVQANGKTVCETSGFSCAIDSLIGPKTAITVTPVSQDGLAGKTAKIAFAGAASLLAGTVWLNTNTGKLTAGERTALNGIAATVKQAGFAKITLIKPVGASAAANAKMVAAQTQLEQALRGQTVKFVTKFSSLASGLDIRLG
jgi:IPT/TIG domain/Beta-propeller repeat